MWWTPAYVKEAKERQRLLRKVFHYRRQQLSADDAHALQELAGKLSQAIKGRKRPQMEVLMTSSNTLLKKVGGHYFRHYHFFENVETFVVAAILAIGIRSFFLQPFKIPTNSMWPTYHGMVYTLDVPPPQGLERIVKLVWSGLSYYRVEAPVAGPVRLALFSATQRAQKGELFEYQIVTRPVLGIIPMPQRQYNFYIGDATVALYVPAEFSLDKLLLQKFFTAKAGNSTLKLDADGLAPTGTIARAGETVLSFQLETGDMLFVDRWSYHWTAPQVGQPIVFRTRGIPGLTELYGGVPDDKYYIKRLVGLPGDTLQIKDSTLYRNAAPITGSPIFEKDARREGEYPGYQARYHMEEAREVTVPAGQYFAMGDNSPESLDSRAWGGLPKDQLVGRAVFIYYPFTQRWGWSR